MPSKLRASCETIARASPGRSELSGVSSTAAMIAPCGMIEARLRMMVARTASSPASAGEAALPAPAICAPLPAVRSTTSPGSLPRVRAGAALAPEADWAAGAAAGARGAGAGLGAG